MAQQKKLEVLAQCGDCNGTGLYSGLCEPDGVAVICSICEGTGAITIKYTPYAGRVTRDNIHTVRQSGGRVITDAGPTGISLTYEEFLEQIPEVTLARV